MTIKKRPDGRWLVDLSLGTAPDGTPVRKRVTRKTKREAEQAERELIIKYSTREMPQGITFAEFVEHIFWREKPGLRPNTRRGYERDLKLRLLPNFGHLQLDDITRSAIQRMITSCPTRKVATNARETLSSILGLAVELGYLNNNPAGFRYQYPRSGSHNPQHIGQWLTSFADHRKLLDYLKEHHEGERIERMVVLGLCFGLRKGEVLGLDWDCVDLEHREIVIRQTYCIAKGGAYMDDPKTENSKRRIPMTSYAFERLSAWSHDGFAVVPGFGSEHLNPHTAASMMRRLVKETYDDGKPLPQVTLHSLRHSFATACIRNGIEVSTVSKILGHRDVTTTYNRYVKPLLDDLKNDAQLIDKAFRCN